MPLYYRYQKPVEEVMHFVRPFAKPGDLVVDPFAAAAWWALPAKCPAGNSYWGTRIPIALTSMHTGQRIGLRKIPREAVERLGSGAIDSSIDSANRPNLDTFLDWILDS